MNSERPPKWDEATMANIWEEPRDTPWHAQPEYHTLIRNRFTNILQWHMRDIMSARRFFINMKVTVPWPNTQGFLDVGPDVFFADADPPLRKSWDIVKEGAPPRFILEVVTDQSYSRDLYELPTIYDDMGAREYAIFIPEEAANGPRLLGYRRNEKGRFTDWEPDIDGALTSAELGGLRLYVENGMWLRVLDAAGQRLVCPQDRHIVPASALDRFDAALWRSVAAQPPDFSDSHVARKAGAARADRIEQTHRAEAAEREVARLRALLATVPPEAE